MNSFVQSEQVLNVIAMSKLYNVRPSDFIGIEDDYTRYCFDEALAYIASRIKDGEKPNFSIKDNKGTIDKPHYSKMSDLYKSMGFSYNSYKKEM